VITTVQLRKELLDDCYRAYSSARDSDRRVRDGIETATNFVENEPVIDDVRAWIANVLAALMRARAVLDNPRDPDGFGIGGVATIRLLVERARDKL